MRFLLKISVLFLAVALVLLQTACNDTDNCRHEEMATVLSVMASDTVKVNTSHVVNISFQVNNGCGSFKKLKESTTGNKIEIEVEAKYRGCICTMDLPILETDYEFKPKSTGTYLLEFGSGSTPDVIKTIEVIE